MTRSTQRNRRPDDDGRGTRALLAAFFILFGLFCLNVLLGKARVQFGWDLPLLGDVAEFLLLLLAAAVLTLAALRREGDTQNDIS